MPYGKANLHRAQEELDRIRREQRGRWKPKDGDNLIRIMPPWSEDEDRFYVQTATHFNVGPQGRVFACPRGADHGAECAICDLVERLEQGDEADHEEAKDIKARRSWLLTVVDLKDPEAGPKTWAAGVQAFQQLLEYLEDPEYGDVTDPEAGYNIKVRKTGKGMNTEYRVRASKTQSPFEHTDLLANLPDLSEFEAYETPDAMLAAYNGVDVPDAEEPEAEEEFDGDETAPPGFDEEEDADAPTVAAEEPEIEEDEDEEPTASPARKVVPRPPAPRPTGRPAPMRPIPPRPSVGHAAVRRALTPRKA